MFYDLVKAMGFGLIDFYKDTKDEAKDERSLFFLENSEVVFANQKLLDKLSITTKEEIEALLKGMLASLIPISMGKQEIIPTEFMATIYNLLKED